MRSDDNPEGGDAPPVPKNYPQRAIVTLTDDNEGGFSTSIEFDPPLPKDGNEPVTSPSIITAVTFVQQIKDLSLMPNPDEIILPERPTPQIILPNGRRLPRG